MVTTQDDNNLDRNTKNTEERNVRLSGCGSKFFEIHVKGHLSPAWSDWLEGLEVKCLDNGEMILSGTIVDQAALMGILNKIYRLNLTLLSVSEVNQKK